MTSLSGNIYTVRMAKRIRKAIQDLRGQSGRKYQRAQRAIQAYRDLMVLKGRS